MELLKVLMHHLQLYHINSRPNSSSSSSSNKVIYPRVSIQIMEVLDRYQPQKKQRLRLYPKAMQIISTLICFKRDRKIAKEEIIDFQLQVQEPLASLECPQIIIII